MADRDRRDHDHAAARRRHHQARVSATIPFPGIAAELVDANGAALEKGGGFLVLTEPWPGMLRTIYGDDARYRETYWSRFPGRYFAGDGAKLDDDGYWWILGRVDDVLNVAGHRIGTMEVESALVDHPAVAEAAVVGKAHDLKGQAIAAFVTLKEGGTPPPRHARRAEGARRPKKIGAIARPDDIIFSADLPKTRSGKIMRRLLRDIAEGRALGDTTTLADPGVVARLREMYEAEESPELELDLRPELHHAIGRQAEEGRRRLCVARHQGEELSSASAACRQQPADLPRPKSTRRCAAHLASAAASASR